MIIKICLVVLVIGIIIYYMIDRYIKILDLTMILVNDFYKKVDFEFSRRRISASNFVEEARELLNEGGDLLDKKNEELFENIMLEANKLLDDDLTIFSREFNEHIEKVQSELLWDWWDIRINLLKYLDKKYINFIMK